jgi:hypothetical protein
MTKPMYNLNSIVTIEFNDGRSMQVTLTQRHYNIIYGEWVYFADELKRNILESNIM